MASETGREAFERWCLSAHSGGWEISSMRRDEQGNYLDARLRSAWDSWIGCTDAAIAKLRELQDKYAAAETLNAAIAALEEMKQ